MKNNASVRVRDSRGRFSKRPDVFQVELGITAVNESDINFDVWLDYDHKEFGVPMGEILPTFTRTLMFLQSTYTKLTGRRLLDDVRCLENNPDWIPGVLKRKSD
jgi:hypothetical protein